MTVRINKPALNLREELTKAQGVVRYEQRQFWMDGLVENGTFDTDTNWTKSGSWSISGGVATQPSGASANYLTQSDVLEIGKVYYYAITLVSGDGSNFAQLYTEAGSVATFASGASEYTGTFTAAGNDVRIRAVSPSLDVSVDNISIFEVDENNDVIHSVPLGFKPVHVYEDGLLQREGENHDYTVVDTGFGYQIKPTVAPSATTETCVIAEREL